MYIYIYVRMLIAGLSSNITLSVLHCGLISENKSNIKKLIHIMIFVSVPDSNGSLLSLISYVFASGS